MGLVQKFLIALALGWVTATQPTIWGGEHVEMEVAVDGARLDFDCAHGTIDEAVRADGKGSFKLKGTFTPERGGPIREGDGSRTVKATYTGTIKDEAMTLAVVLDGQEQPVNTYELFRDRPGRVRKCR